MILKKHRLLSQGSLPNSDGGVFNPSCVSHDTWVREFIVRVEPISHYYTNDSTVSLIVEKIDKMRAGEIDNIYHLEKKGYPPHSKIEDFRLFRYKGELYAIHTMCITKRGWEDSTFIKPVISKVTRSTIEFVDYCELPYVNRKIGEKNWLPIVHNDELYILYSLDPLRIFKLEGWSWREHTFHETGLADHVKKMLPGSSFLSLSAITHFENEHYIGMWHVRFEDEVQGWIYVQGMFILNMKTFKIDYFTPPVLQGGGLEGNRPDVLYVSGLVATPLMLEVYAGEADSHSVLIELDRKEVTAELNKHEFKYTAPIRILMKDRGVGDFICMAYALMGWMMENPGRGIKLYVTVNLQLASVLKLPGVKICSYHGDPIDIDLTSNEDSLPEDQRKEYAEKIKGSLKDWYCKKLKTIPYNIPVKHITSLEGYEGVTVLFPFVGPIDSIRAWPLKYWIELATRLIASGQRVIICDQFVARCKNIPGEHLPISLFDVLRLIKGAGLVICNESGGAHMAGLFDTPTLVLSAWLDPEKVYDRTNNSWIFKKPLHSITVDEVIEKTKAMK